MQYYAMAKKRDITTPDLTVSKSMIAAVENKVSVLHHFLFTSCRLFHYSCTFFAYVQAASTIQAHVRGYLARRTQPAAKSSYVAILLHPPPFPAAWTPASPPTAPCAARPPHVAGSPRVSLRSPWCLHRCRRAASCRPRMSRPSTPLATSLGTEISPSSRYHCSCVCWWECWGQWW
jgi:hypothetical protein